MVSRRFVGVASLATATLGMTALFAAAHAQAGTGASGSTRLDAHRTLGGPKTYRNLTLFPIYDAGAKEHNRYITLDEGLKARTVTVKESTDGGSVNTLYITNTGLKPLYVMAGEVVLGGQQDRTLGRDTIVAAGKRNVPVTVFCVEHGRWSGRAEFAKSAPTVAGRSIRADAMAGDFNAEQRRVVAGAPVAGAPQARTPGRIAMSAGRRQVAGGAGEPVQQTDGAADVAKAQQQVWDEVESKNTKLKIRNQTGTYRDALTLNVGEAHSRVPAYVKSLSGELGHNGHLIGVVAAVNGKVIAADVFSDPALFRKLWPKLLRSYASDAVEAESSGGATRKKTAAIRDVKSFVASARNERSKQVNESEYGSTVRYESAGASLYSLVPAHGAGFGAPPLHESVIKK